MWPQWPKLAFGELFWSRVYRLRSRIWSTYFFDNEPYSVTFVRFFVMWPIGLIGSYRIKKEISTNRPLLPFGRVG